jgi:hypothetical protein
MRIEQPSVVIEAVAVVVSPDLSSVAVEETPSGDL